MDLIQRHHLRKVNIFSKKKFKKKTENEQSMNDGKDNLPWRDSLVLLKGKADQKHSHWPIPESYWPDSVKYGDQPIYTIAKQLKEHAPTTHSASSDCI